MDIPGDIKVASLRHVTSLLIYVTPSTNHLGFWVKFAVSGGSTISHRGSNPYGADLVFDLFFL